MLQESKKKQYEWKVNSFGIKQILKYRKRPNTVCGNVLPACADQETFSRGVLCIILFSREEGWGASEAYFREFYDVNLIDLNLTNFHPPPNKATHGLWNWQQLELFVIVYQMLLAAVFVILKLFQNNLPSFASTWQVVVWQRLVVSCMVMWWCGTRTRCLTAPSPNRLSSSVF